MQFIFCGSIANSIFQADKQLQLLNLRPLMIWLRLENEICKTYKYLYCWYVALPLELGWCKLFYKGNMVCILFFCVKLGRTASRTIEARAPPRFACVSKQLFPCYIVLCSKAQVTPHTIITLKIYIYLHYPKTRNTNHYST